MGAATIRRTEHGLAAASCPAEGRFGATSDAALHGISAEKSRRRHDEATVRNGKTAARNADQDAAGNGEVGSPSPTNAIRRAPNAWHVHASACGGHSPTRARSNVRLRPERRAYPQRAMRFYMKRKGVR